MLTRVVSDSPFRARELIDRVCAGTRDAFGFKRVDWLPPHGLVPVAVEGEPQPDQADLSVLSALGEAAAAVAEKARDVGDADRLKHDFVSIASHELRAPISVVHGIAATLNARVDDLRHDQVHALLGQLVLQTDRLRDLADQLLDLSRIESRRRGRPAGALRPARAARRAGAADRGRARRRRARGRRAGRSRSSSTRSPSIGSPRT